MNCVTTVFKKWRLWQMFQNLFFKFLNKSVWNRRTIAHPVAYYDIGQFSIFFLTSEKNLIGHNWYQDPLTRRHLMRGVVIFHKNKEFWAVQYSSRHTHTHTYTHFIIAYICCFWRLDQNIQVAYVACMFWYAVQYSVEIIPVVVLVLA